MTLMVMGVLPPTRRVLVSDMSWETFVRMLELEELTAVVVVTGTSITLFQLGCLLTQSGSLFSPSAFAVAIVLMSSPILLKIYRLEVVL